jgi:RNA recognition motif-containing protein
MMPANKDDLDRIARNIINGCAPNYMGVYKLYVGNLDFTTTSDQLLQFIESNIQQSSSSTATTTTTTTTTTATTEEGGGGSGSKRNKVCDVSLVKGQDGRPRGFAFVSFYDEEDGKRTLISCNGKECNGRELIVKEPNN